MKFKDSVQRIGELAPHYYQGLQALKKRSSCVAVISGCERKLTGSVDLDSAFRPSNPRESVWDYCVGISTGKAEEIHWIEIHPASTSEIPVVLKKLAWLKQWLREEGTPLRSFPSHYIWISSGKTRLSPTATQRKIIAREGLTQKGNLYSLPC